MKWEDAFTYTPRAQFLIFTAEDLADGADSGLSDYLRYMILACRKIRLTRQIGKGPHRLKMIRQAYLSVRTILISRLI